MGEIVQFVTRYVEGFSGDPSVTAEFYAEPMIYVGTDGVSVFHTRREAIASFATAYADQTSADYAALVKAKGTKPTATKKAKAA